jgi:hypothetical protein
VLDAAERAFYTFGLILLPTLAFVGLATFHRVLQTGIEDFAYAPNRAGCYGRSRTFHTIMTTSIHVSNAKAKRELGWSPAVHSSHPGG